MRKLWYVITICLLAVPVFCEPASKYQVGTIIDVKPHHPTSDESSEVVRYDVSLKVGDTIFLTLYAPPFGLTTVKYAAGRDVVVLVGKKTIIYNDLLGRPIEVPIVSQKTVAHAEQSK